MIAGTVALAAWARRGAARRIRSRGRMYVALTALSGGVFDALELIRARPPDWRLLGAVAYWLFDVGALYACLLAYGPAPSFWAVSMAYLVGMLANSLPIPAGLIAVEGGLFGMLLLFGVRPGIAGARGRGHLPGGLAVGARADRLGGVPQHPRGAQPSRRARVPAAARRRLSVNATCAAACWQAWPGRLAIARSQRRLRRP